MGRMMLKEKFDGWQYRRLKRRIARYEKYIAKVKLWLKEDKKMLRRMLKNGNGDLTKY